MMNFFDKEEILESYIRSERYEAAQEATQEATRRATQETIQKATQKTKKTAITLIKNGRLSVDEIPTFFPELTVDDIEDIKKEVIQLV